MLHDGWSMKNIKDYSNIMVQGQQERKIKLILRKELVVAPVHA
jgi:hypothetical protein